MPRIRFRPNTDGFAFANGFDLTAGELATVKDIVKKASGVALTALSPGFGLLDALGLLVGIPPGTIEAAAAIAITAGAVDGLIDTNFSHTGLCGGMAWTACDYWMQGWAVNRGDDTVTLAALTDPRARALRDYLWNRHLDTYAAGVAADTLIWLAILKLIPEGAGGGPRALMARSRGEWRKLKAVLDQGRPCPLALIYDVWNPGKNHQLLAYGYDGDLPGTVTIYAYDNNSPDTETVLTYEFGAAQFEGDDRGFFVPSYSPKRPPLGLGLVQSLTAAPHAPYTVGEHVTFSYAVGNVGCGTSVGFTRGVHGHQAPAWVLDTPARVGIPAPHRPGRPLPAEAPPEREPPPMHQLPELDFFAHQPGAAVALVPGGVTPATVPATMGAAAWDVTAVVDVGPIDGAPSYKVVPKASDVVNDHLRLVVPKPRATPTPTTHGTGTGTGTGTGDGEADGTPPPPTPHSPSRHPIPHILRPR